MKYLKLFENSNIPSLDKIAEDIVKYTKEYGEFNYELDEMIRSVYWFAIGDEDRYFEEDLTPNIVKQSLEYIKRISKRDFENILDWHAEISKTLDYSSKSMSNHEMEDYFLDMEDYKYDIVKKYDYGNIIYKIHIKSIPTEKVPMINNRIWQTTMKRIPSDYILTNYDLEINKKMIGDSISTLNSYDLTINILHVNK